MRAVIPAEAHRAFNILTEAISNRVEAKRHPNRYAEGPTLPFNGHRPICAHCNLRRSDLMRLRRRYGPSPILSRCDSIEGCHYWVCEDCAQHCGFNGWAKDSLTCDAHEEKRQ